MVKRVFATAEALSKQNQEFAAAFTSKGIPVLKYQRDDPEDAPKFSVDDSDDTDQNDAEDRDSTHKRSSPVWGEVEIKPLPESEFLEKAKTTSRALILALDHVTDPRNVGAIVRSAAFFGVAYILVPERRQAILSDVVVNTAQAGFARCQLVVIKNMTRILRELKDIEYWILGADGQGEPYQKLANFYDKSVLVLGAEDTGISQLVHQTCDRIVAIPGSKNGVESLNVSVAAGILLAALAPV